MSQEKQFVVCPDQGACGYFQHVVNSRRYFICQQRAMLKHKASELNRADTIQLKPISSAEREQLNAAIHHNVADTLAAFPLEKYRHTVLVNIDGVETLRYFSDDARVDVQLSNISADSRITVIATDKEGVSRRHALNAYNTIEALQDDITYIIETTGRREDDSR